MPLNATVSMSSSFKDRFFNLAPINTQPFKSFRISSNDEPKKQDNQINIKDAPNNVQTENQTKSLEQQKQQPQQIQTHNEPRDQLHEDEPLAKVTVSTKDEKLSKKEKKKLKKLEWLKRVPEGDALVDKLKDTLIEERTEKLMYKEQVKRLQNNIGKARISYLKDQFNYLQNLIPDVRLEYNCEKDKERVINCYSGSYYDKNSVLNCNSLNKFFLECAQENKRRILNNKDL